MTCDYNEYYCDYYDCDDCNNTNNNNSDCNTSGCDKDNCSNGCDFSHITSIAILSKGVTLHKGNGYYPSISTSPAEADCNAVTWMSDDTSVVTVDPTTGFIRAVGEGSATVYVYTTDGSALCDCINVVVEHYVPVAEIFICPETLNMKIGDSETLTAHINPCDATDKSIRWISCNPSVASVDSNGKVCAIAEGNTEIWAESYAGAYVYGICAVNVGLRRVERIDIIPSLLDLRINQSEQLEKSLTPENPTLRGVEWASCDTSIASVTQAGKVTGISPGSTMVTATACDGSGCVGCCYVTVNSADEGDDETGEDNIPEHSSHIYNAVLSENGDNYIFTCEVSQCNDTFVAPKDQVIGAYVASSTDSCLGNSEEPLAYGIDVSKWQGAISQEQWNAIANTQIDGHTITFAILRIGTELNPINGVINRQKDETFENNYARAKAAGLQVGCYYYTESWTAENAIRDAEQVIEWIGNKQFEYPIFFDIESSYISDNNNVPNNTVRTEICTAFMNKMREEGFFTGLYTNNDWINNKLNSSTLLPEYDFWYARYDLDDPTPNSWGKKSGESDWAGEGNKFGMWQYTDQKNIAPVSGNVDCNVAYKNYPLIIKSLHLNNF